MTTKPTPPPKKKVNWAAVSAVAAVAGVLIALLAYAIPHSSSPPTASPSPAYPSGSPRTGGMSSQAPASYHSNAPLSVTDNDPTGPPPGCQQGNAVITRYNSMVGSTQASRVQAATRAATDIYQTESESTDATVREDLQTLYQDFTSLSEYAGGGSHFSSSYNTAYAQTQKDIQAFDKDCNSTG